MSLGAARRAVHVEVCVKQSVGRLESLEHIIEDPLREYIARRALPLNKVLSIETDTATNAAALDNVDTFLLECSTKQDGELTSVADVENLCFHFYRPQRRPMELEMFETESEGGGESEAVPSSNHWLLPSQTFVGLWEHLIYEGGLKEKLLNFALSALTFSQHQVNPNIICCNRLILLHGPPGTGKTSLCKALAQKLAIRTRKSFRHTHLVEINSHSLFSKWFSESGKLVMRLFGKIREIVSDTHNLVCVLIDEVESLAYARECMSGQEPKDAMRVVNALLTQLDAIKEYPNVLILATSNLADTIDLAFLDRADVKQYIGMPSVAAIRRIYESMLLELMRVGIISDTQSLNSDDTHNGLLDDLSSRSLGLSGRTLRKIPFLAHAMHSVNEDFKVREKFELSDFLDTMLTALEKHNNDQKFELSDFLDTMLTALEKFELSDFLDTMLTALEKHNNDQKFIKK